MNPPTATPRTDAAWAASFSPDRANFSVRDECEKLETELETEKTNRNHLIEKGAKLETELATMKAEFEKIILLAAQAADRNVELRRLAEKAECNRLYESSPTALDALTAELTRLRAQEGDYRKIIAEVLKCEPRPACEQPDNQLEAPWEVVARLRAELARLRAEVSEARRAWLGDDYGHLPLIEALEKFRSDSDAKSDRADVLYQRSCEVEHKLRAEVERLKDCAFDKDGTPWKTVCGWWSAKYDAAERQMGENAARAEKAEAECLEQARLLGKSGEREADLLGKLERLNRVIERASVQFFHDGSDGETAAKMLTVLNEAK